MIERFLDDNYNNNDIDDHKIKNKQEYTIKIEPRLYISCNSMHI